MSPYLTLREEVPAHAPRPRAATRRKLKRADRRRTLAYELKAEADCEAEEARELRNWERYEDSL